MGISGGSTGAFSLPNHEHTNVLLDGGALDEAVSLINDGAADVTLLAWLNGKVAKQSANNTVNQTTSSSYPTYVDVTNVTLTMPNHGGKAIISAEFEGWNDTAAAGFFVRLLDDTTELMKVHMAQQTAAYYMQASLSGVVDCDGQVVKMQMCRHVSGIVTAKGGGGTDGRCYIKSLEFGG